MSSLFQEFQVKDLIIKNRIVMAPMCMYMAEYDGCANDWHFVHYITRAVGGVGLIILEATGVENRGRITSKDLGLWDDEQIEGLKRIVKSCHKQGAKVGIQLAHAGRKSEVLEEPSIAPSPIAFSEAYRIPTEMSQTDIRNVIKAFRDAAIRANIVGFDTIEIHAAHGYLISEFLSPLTNKRNDEYGGNEENRARFLKEILAEVNAVWPENKPIMVRVSTEDYEDGGNNDDTVANIINSLKYNRIDLVDVSSGGVVNVNMKVYPGYQVRYAETMKRVADLPVITGGLITSPLMAEEILQNKRADFIFLGRELLRNPYWPLEAARQLKVNIDWPLPYIRGCQAL